MAHLPRPLKSKKGSAILLAIFTVTFVIFLATEVSQQTIMEYLASSTEIKKVQARTTAQACLRLNLLRIKAYQQAARSLGDVLPDMSMLDMIWSFPLSWPPTLPSEISSFDSSTIKQTVGGSLMKHQFVSEISAEGGKIDINDLGSPSEGLRTKTRQQLLQRLQSRVLNGEDSFATRYANFNFEELIYNIGDWIDDDMVSLNGGSERSYYSDIDNEFIPPNRPFKTEEELHMVAGMTDEIYQELIPHITLYGVKGINVNQADRDVLLSLFSTHPPEIADEIVTEILKRRSSPELGGPFKDEKEFLGFLDSFIDSSSFNDEENKVPLFFGAELNFRINCIGVVGKMTTEIEAVVYDTDSIKTRLQSALIEDNKKGNNNQPSCPNLSGDALYKCLCDNLPTDDEKQQCVAQKKKKAQDQSNKKKEPIPPGPPQIIFQRVR